MNERNIVTVFYPETEWQGDLIVQELKTAGIDAYLANRSSASLWGDAMPMVKMEVLVPEENAQAAKELIDQLLNQPTEPLPEEDWGPEQEGAPSDPSDSPEKGDAGV